MATDPRPPACWPGAGPTARQEGTRHVHRGFAEKELIPAGEDSRIHFPFLQFIPRQNLRLPFRPAKCMLTKIGRPRPFIGRPRRAYQIRPARRGTCHLRARVRQRGATPRAHRLSPHRINVPGCRSAYSFGRPGRSGPIIVVVIISFAIHSS